MWPQGAEQHIPRLQGQRDFKTEQCTVQGLNTKLEEGGGSVYLFEPKNTGSVLSGTGRHLKGSS